MAHCTKSQGGTFFTYFSTACGSQWAPPGNRRMRLRSSRQGDVVAHVVGKPGDAVVQPARRRIVGFGMPVDPAPSPGAAAGDERIDELSPPSGAASRRLDPQVFEIADHPAAEGVRTKHVVCKACERAVANGRTAHQSAYRIVRVHDSPP